MLDVSESTYSGLEKSWEKSSAEKERQLDQDDNAQTIGRAAPHPQLQSASSPNLCVRGPIVEDYSDLTTEEDDEWQEKLAPQEPFSHLPGS